MTVDARLLRALTSGDAAASRDILTGSGVDTRIVDGVLLARLPGRGRAKPLLLHGHHTTAVAIVSALLRMVAAEERPAGDVLFVMHRNGDEPGMDPLVDWHPELLADVRVAVGDVGGARLESVVIGCHPVVVAEKRVCWVRIRLRGIGRPSWSAAENVLMGRLGMVLTALSGARFPRHMTPEASRMLDALAGVLPQQQAERVWRLRADHVHDRVPAGLPLVDALYLDSVLRNTANPTVIHGDEPSGVLTVDVDGRVLPGVSSSEFLAELRAIVGGGVEIEVLREDPSGHGVPVAEPELGAFYDRLTDVVVRADPSAVPLPMIAPASSGVGRLARLGIRSYGWLPSGEQDLRFATDRLIELLRDFP